MIRKLRKKFIFINMLLVSTVLILVFVFLCFSSYKRLKGESIDAMEHALEAPPANKDFFSLKQGKKPFRDAINMVPIFLATIKDGTTTSTSEQNDFIPSEELLTESVFLAQNSGKTQGMIMELQLRFIIKQTDTETKIAFADMSHEIRSIQNMLWNSFFILILGMAAFFIISLFLANWALKPVEEAWIRQRQFIADASHELKTPLTVILANTKILRSHPLETIAHQMKWIDNTNEEAGRMKQLVDSLLFLAKSDSQQAPLNLQEFDLSDTAFSCLLTLESLAFEQNITIKEKIEPSILFTGDISQIKQLLVILLDNACKYVNSGGTVTLTLKKEQGKIHLLLNNTGTFIPTEDLEHIFERFYRSDKSRVRKEGGYGLGLSIAKRIVENHHGKITVASDERKGTTFQILFHEK